MSFRRLIPAGLADSGLASVATFLTGLAAARLLSPVELGAYGLFLTGFKLASVVAWQLVLVPSEVQAVRTPPRDRPAVIKSTLRVAAVPALLAAAATPLTALLVKSSVSTAVLVGLVVTTAVTTLFSPLQDHVRRVFHLAELSWGAAVISLVQLTVVVTLLIGLHSLEVERAWIPLGALAGANLVSFMVGTTILLLFARGHSTSGDHKIRQLSRTGRWFLGTALMPTGAAFAVNALVSSIAGFTILGLAEVARVVAQPLNVFGEGLGSVLNPHSMRSAHQKDLARARKVSRIFQTLATGLGLLYALFVTLSPGVQLIEKVLPNAYVVPGLVTATVAAAILASVVRPYRAEMVGAEIVGPLAKGDGVANGLRVLTGFTVSSTGAFALPFGQGVAGLAQLAFYRRYLADHYSDQHLPADPPPITAGTG